ncbi:MAG: hypothetical protein AB8H79_23300 [Myxococcota bacterium]
MSRRTAQSTSILGIVGFMAVSLACGGLDFIDIPEPDLAERLAYEKAQRELKATGGTWCNAPVARTDLWIGEYPDPVVNITESMEFPSHSDPCLKAADTTCKVEAGVYHPWGKGDGYVTVQTQVSYTATKDVNLGDEDDPALVKAGDTVLMESYLAEGQCMLNINGKSTVAMCPGMGEEDGLEEVKGPKFEPKQFLNPGCGSWIEINAAFFEQPEVKKGNIVEYGKVGE